MAEEDYCQGSRDPSRDPCRETTSPDPEPEDPTTKDDEFSNMIGLEEVNEETTEQTLYHLGLHLEQLRRDSMRSSMRSSRLSDSLDEAGSNSNRLSFSRKKSQQLQHSQPHQSLSDKRKSFVAKLRRIQSERAPGRSVRGCQVSGDDSQLLPVVQH